MSSKIVKSVIWKTYDLKVMYNLRIKYTNIRLRSALSSILKVICTESVPFHCVQVVSLNYILPLYHPAIFLVQDFFDLVY